MAKDTLGQALKSNGEMQKAAGQIAATAANKLATGDKAKKAQRAINTAQQVAGYAGMARQLAGAGAGKPNGSAGAGRSIGGGANGASSAATAAAAAAGIIHAVGVDIVIGGKLFEKFYSFQLQQTATSHHNFRLVLAHDAGGSPQDQNLEEARSYLGQRLMATFYYRSPVPGGAERSFRGVVTQVGFAQEEGYMGHVVLSGYSPDVLLDGAPHIQSFEAQSLRDIATELVKQGGADAFMETDFNPGFTSNLSYTCQYNETHYNYLARMAAAYGEWFFYDGVSLHFGKPSLAAAVPLVYGKDTSQVELKMNAGHVAQKHYGYNSSRHEPLSAGTSKVDGLGELGGFSYRQSQELFKAPSLQVSPVRAGSNQDVETTQQAANATLASRLFTVSGSTSVPFLYPGCLIELSFRKTDSSEVEYFGRLIVVQVQHSLSSTGSYSGYFEAIPGDVSHFPRPSFVQPVAEPQMATVTDNKDSQGRVKVRFDWQGNGHTTDWVRVMSPDAGSSDKVGKNRGLVTIPEVGDQVMVGFVHSHPDRPFVMGGLFHGKAGSGGGSGNNIKSLSSKSGHTIRLNDGGGITVKDKAGNTIHVDGGGNITATSSATNSTDVGKGAAKMKMDSGGNISIEGNAKIELKVGSSSITITPDTIDIKATNNNITGTNNTVSGQNHITGGDTKIDQGNVFIN